MTDVAATPVPESARTEDTPFESVSPVAQPLDVAQDRQWATLAHLGGVVGALPSYLIHRVFTDRGPFTAQESREALNHTLLPSLIILAGIVLSLVPVAGGVFSVVAAVTWVYLAVTSVRAGIKVNRGEPHQYRFSTHFYDRVTTGRA
ncbi:DUF4870 domain-containing protein [Kocuria tytonicola]|uniref:DUF4870 domain-containing protein n=1 Tax=Kocuria tytonicola TaxID=2055946 RepID=A0A3L9L7T9_9MICC|nr:DUF4870 domain-containing protein [Kocuria tytonicola]RLY94973.1 DUF4870 domain-containing protein [Kocuria tytonicola]